MGKKIKADGTTVTTRSTAETGHAKNVASFSTLVQQVSDLGLQYNPGNELIQLLMLRKKEALVNMAMSNLLQAKQTKDDAENERTVLFRQLSAYATRIVSTLNSSAQVSALTIKDAQIINNKIRGARSSKSKQAIAKASAEGGEQPRTRSVSQQSYDQKLNHFIELRKLVMAQPTYLPNEGDLKLSGLEDYEDKLLAANQKMIAAASKLTDARIDRDKHLYEEETGMVAMTKKVKAYVKGIFTAKHIQFKKINSIPFKTLKDKSSSL